MCHSIDRVHYRELVGVTHSAEELLEMASEVDFLDGPNNEGEMFERPGKLADPLQSSYQNEEQGRMANGGSLPPDLRLIVKARHEGVEYEDGTYKIVIVDIASPSKDVLCHAEGDSLYAVRRSPSSAASTTAN
jgi:cytochrome c1